MARATEAETRDPGSDAAAYDNASLLRRLGETNATSPVTHRSGVPIFSVAARATEKTPPSSSSSPSAFQTFGRTYWPFFLVLQTLALIGAAISGVSSRKKRLELASLNEKLRQLAERDDENACAFDWDNLEGQCTDSWPGAPQIAAGTEALKAGNTEAALEAFQEARAACESAFANDAANDAATTPRRPSRVRARSPVGRRRRGVPRRDQGLRELLDEVRGRGEPACRGAGAAVRGGSGARRGG